MPKTKKKEIYLIDCPHCDSFDAETWELIQTHIDLVHATVYEKACRGDYDSKLPYKENRDAYHEDQHRLNALFKNDLAIEHGVENNSKKEKLFDIAWSQGHSSGFSEVVLHYSEMVDLIK